MVITDVNQVTYNGDGTTTAFPFTFKIIDATNIKLILIAENGLQTEITSDYYVDVENQTVYYPGYAPGSEPPEADQPAKLQVGEKLEIYRWIPINQLADLGEKWPFAVIEAGLDKLTMLLQDIYGWVGRNLINKVTGGTAWDADNLPISNVGGPFSVTDAATKDYVDKILSGIIESGDGRVIPYDTVAQMRAGSLEAGQIAFTLGYHDINDGGAGVYTIRTATLSDVDDGGSVIILDNGNVAELITDDTVKIKQFGVVGDGNEDDSSKLQNAINFARSIDLQGFNCLIGTAITLRSDIIIKNGTLTIGDDGTFVSATSCDNIEFNNVDIVFTTDTYDTGSYGQVLFTSCNNVNVTGGTYDAKAQRCITFLTCNNVCVDGVKSTNVKGTAITFNGGDNLNVVNCVFDGVDLSNQTNGKHMLDVYGKSDNVHGVTIDNCFFENHGYNGLQFTSTPSSKTIVGAKVIGCTFQNYGEVGIKVDGVDDLITIQNCTFYKGKEAVSISGASGTADKILVDNCLFDGLTEYIFAVNVSKNVAGTPNFTMLKITNSTFVNMTYRLVRLPAEVFGDFIFEHNYINKAAFRFFRNSGSTDAGSFIIRNNKIIKPSTDGWAMTVANVSYVDISNNYFDTPYAQTPDSGILGDIRGKSDGSTIARFENNTLINAGTYTKLRTVETLNVVYLNGNTADGNDITWYNVTPSINTLIAYVIATP